MSYAFKKDTKGERHGTPAERQLAARQKAQQAQQSRPNTLFATGMLLSLHELVLPEVYLLAVSMVVV